jgi:hypothetical protein
MQPARSMCRSRVCPVQQPETWPPLVAAVRPTQSRSRVPQPGEAVAQTPELEKSPTRSCPAVVSQNDSRSGRRPTNTRHQKRLQIERFLRSQATRNLSRVSPAPSPGSWGRGHAMHASVTLTSLVGPEASLQSCRRGEMPHRRHAATLPRRPACRALSPSRSTIAHPVRGRVDRRAPSRTAVQSLE